ncbi:hypothetical protein BSKO_05819 [Bryopsis sp. KO-2023]|nr:hypothetical protein BSKO_05819 [Bryopsis sp. KO-2023]
MQDVIVNYIKSNALNSRLFEQICIDFGSEYKHLPFYSLDYRKVETVEREDGKGSTCSFFVAEWIDDVNFEDVKANLISHLEQLIDDFDRYILDDQLPMGRGWIRNPFLVNVGDLEEEDEVAEDLIDIQHDGNF